MGWLGLLPLCTLYGVLVIIEDSWWARIQVPIVTNMEFLAKTLQVGLYNIIRNMYSVRSIAEKGGAFIRSFFDFQHVSSWMLVVAAGISRWNACSLTKCSSHVIGPSDSYQLNVGLSIPCIDCCCCNRVDLPAPLPNRATVSAQNSAAPPALFTQIRNTICSDH